MGTYIQQLEDHYRIWIQEDIYLICINVPVSYSQNDCMQKSQWVCWQLATAEYCLEIDSRIRQWGFNKVCFWNIYIASPAHVILSFNSAIVQMLKISFLQITAHESYARLLWNLTYLLQTIQMHQNLFEATQMEQYNTILVLHKKW